MIDAAHAEAVVRSLSRLPPTIEGNLQAWEYLRGLKTVFVEREKRERNVQVLHPVDVGANAFHVTEEFTASNGTYRIRPDVVFLVNGVPVIIVEAKAATRRDGIDEALEQIRRYHREGPELLALCQLFGLTRTPQLFYGATWSLSRKTLFNWRDEAGAPASRPAGDPASTRRRPGFRLRDELRDVGNVLLCSRARAAGADRLHPLHPHRRRAG